jgi:uncharacterized membrane protein YuzA (DUF378 family)
MRTIDWIALAIVIIGALNWGIVGLTGYDIFGPLFGVSSLVSRIIYGIVGLSTLYLIIISFTTINDCSNYLLGTRTTRV